MKAEQAIAVVGAGFALGGLVFFLVRKKVPTAPAPPERIPELRYASHLGVARWGDLHFWDVDVMNTGDTTLTCTVTAYRSLNGEPWEEQTDTDYELPRSQDIAAGERATFSGSFPAPDLTLNYYVVNSEAGQIKATFDERV